MVVTERHRILVAFGILLGLSLVFGFACTVDVNRNTVGAARGCDPSSTELNFFYANVHQEMLTKTCTNCHSTNNPYLIPLVTPTGVQAQRDFFCSSDSIAEKLMTVPFTMAPHNFTTSDLPEILNWAQSRRK